MQINKLVLRNIGAYYGELNKFNFRTNSKNNVILLGGKNGAGKTTILEALRIVLFGSMAYGYVTDNEPYFRKIKSLLNHKALQEGSKDNYQIHLEYSSTEGLQENTYNLIRSWTIKNEKIKEHFIVRKNGAALPAYEISNYQNKLREEMPPRLFELCLFDGEDISRIVSEGRIPEYLRDSGKILFNLDLFVNLEQDLQTYRIQYTQKNSEITKELEEKSEFETQILNYQKQLSQNEELISASEEKIRILNDLIKQDRKDFEIHGGLIQEQRQELVSKVNKIENERKANSDRIKFFINSLLPFYISRETLGDVAKQLSEEKQFESYEFIASTLNEDSLSTLLNRVHPDGVESNINANDLYAGLLQLIKPNDVNVIHRASFEQQSEIHSLNKKVQDIDNKFYINLFDINAKMLDESQKLRKSIELNDESSEFSELLDRIEERTREVEHLKLVIENTSAEILQIKETIKTIAYALDKINDKIKEHHKAEDSFLMTEKLLMVSQRFRERQWRKKLDDVANEATKMINILFRKKSYIDRIHIDHSSFELHLYNKHNQEITKERLSAGEKEMLMLTVIWAMFKVSGWKLPFVFDTLMGRLDQDHKKALIEHFIPRCGEQVLIFTTDSEIAEEQFDLIKDITSLCYTLEFNAVQETAEIVKGRYFNLSKEYSQQ